MNQKLLATHKRITITVIFCCIGWPVFIYGFNGDGMLLTLLGAVIVSAPILWRIWRGGLSGAFKLDTTEYITTYSDGSKTSDGGYASMSGSLIVNIFLFLLMVFVGCLATLIYLTYLVITYIIQYLRVNEKPAFIKSAFPVMLAGLLVLIFSNLIINLIK